MAADAFDVELALDRVVAELDRELPTHVAAFARAHAAGVSPPGAPALAHDVATVRIAQRALAFVELRPRASALLRIVAPLAIEHSPPVVRARAAARTWAAWRRLVEARDAAARALFGIGHTALIDRLGGAEREASEADQGADEGADDGAAPARPDDVLAPPIAGWLAPAPDSEPLPARAVEEVWALACERQRVAPGGLEIVRSAVARPRCFLIERGARAIVVIPPVLDTPAARFQSLHELGHALLGLASRREWPRAVDEAAASSMARAMERPELLPAGWFSPLAAPARARRLALARGLAAIERGCLEPPRELARPPSALWDDAAAQAAYARAETLADVLPVPVACGHDGARGTGGLVEACEREAARIDAALAL